MKIKKTRGRFKEVPRIKKLDKFLEYITKQIHLFNNDPNTKFTIGSPPDYETYSKLISYELAVKNETSPLRFIKSQAVEDLIDSLDIDFSKGNIIIKPRVFVFREASKRINFAICNKIYYEDGIYIKFGEGNYHTYFLNACKVKTWGHLHGVVDKALQRCFYSHIKKDMDYKLYGNINLHTIDIEDREKAHMITDSYDFAIKMEIAIKIGLVQEVDYTEKALLLPRRSIVVDVAKKYTHLLGQDTKCPHYVRPHARCLSHSRYKRDDDGEVRWTLVEGHIRGSKTAKIVEKV